MNHQRFTTSLLAVCASLIVFACGKTNDPSRFGAGQSSFDGAATATSAYVKSFKWSGPTIIDADPNMAQAWDVNSDMNTSCQSMFTNGGSQRGCMQAPPVVYSDNRWFTGFTQNYLWSAAWAADTLYSAFASMTSLTSRAFGTLGSGLGLIDPALVFSTAAANPLSVRYLRFASFPNGNVIAVYIVENSTTYTNGTVFATIYSASTHSWGSAVQLGTTANRINYNASDYQLPAGTFYLARFCRPTVATSGNNSAMVTWCEDTGAGAFSRSEIMYARYINGSWTKLAGGSAIASPDELIANTTVYSNPGYHGIFHYLGVTPASASCTFPTYGTFVADKEVWRIRFSTNSTNRYYADVEAVTTNAGVGQFNVVKDQFSNVQHCATLQNLANALMSKVPVDNVNGADCALFPTSCVTATKTLAQMGVSLVLDPGCSDVTPAQATRNLGVYYNRQLANRFRDPSGTTDNTVLPMMRGLKAVGASTAASDILVFANDSTLTSTTGIAAGMLVYGPGIIAGTTVDSVTATTVDISTPAIATNGNAKFYFMRALDATAACAQSIPGSQQDAAYQSGGVDVAGDGFGNYAVVRTMVAPALQQSGVYQFDGSSTWTYRGGIDGTQDAKGRMLVGHQYLASGSWLTTSKATGRNSLESQSPGCSATSPPICPTVAEPAAALLKTDFLSNPPVCDTGVANGTAIGPNESVACSVRNPRILMSNSGKGLILFHQNQPQPYLTSQAYPQTVAANPNRLWWTTYSTASGFGGVASPLDADTFCSTSSVRNDRPVCETGSHEANFTNVTSTFSTNCQSFEESRNWSKLPGTAIVKPPVTIDVPPIAAAMNANGQAVIAYNKIVNYGTALSPNCRNIGTWVVTYDPFNGMSSATQLDDGLGDTMHANVAISAGGKMAVIWEERAPYAAPTATYVYLRTYSNGVWSSQVQVNDSLTDNNTSASGLFPSVGINDLGEVVATFTYGGPSTTNVRHQYVKHYYNY